MHANLEARNAVQKAEPQEIQLQESQRRPRDHGQHARPARAVAHVERAPAGVAIELVQVLVRVPRRVVQQRMLERAEPALPADRLLHAPSVFRSGTVAAEQADHVVAVPAAMLDAVAQVVIRAVDPVAVLVRRRRLEHLANFLGQLGRHALVGIDDQHPLVPGLRNRPVLEVGRVDVFSLDDAAAADVADDVERAVGRAGIGDENFVGDCLHRFDASTDVAPLILAGNEHGEFCCHVRNPRSRKRVGRRVRAHPGVAISVIGTSREEL